MSRPRLAYSIKTASEETGLSTSYLDRAIKAGELRAKKSGRTKDGEPVGKYVILATALESFLEQLEDA